MPEIKLSCVRSYSSQDPKHPAENLITRKGNWLISSKESGSLSATFQLDSLSHISSVHLGNCGSAFVSLQVCRYGLDDFEEFLPCSSLMTVGDSRGGVNKNTVRMFHKDQFLPETRDQRWDQIRVSVTQPFNHNTLFGLSFLRLWNLAYENDPAFITTNSHISEVEKNKWLSTFRPRPHNSFQFQQPLHRSHRLLLQAGQSPFMKPKTEKPSESEESKDTEREETSDEEIDKDLFEATVISFMESLNLNEESESKIALIDIRKKMERIRGKEFTTLEKSLLKRVVTEFLKSQDAERLKASEVRASGSVRRCNSPESSSTDSPFESARKSDLSKNSGIPKNCTKSSSLPSRTYTSQFRKVHGGKNASGSSAESYSGDESNSSDNVNANTEHPRWLTTRSVEPEISAPGPSRRRNCLSMEDSGVADNSNANEVPRTEINPRAAYVAKMKNLKRKCYSSDASGAETNTKVVKIHIRSSNEDKQSSECRESQSSCVEVKRESSRAENVSAPRSEHSFKHHSSSSEESGVDKHSKVVENHASPSNKNKQSSKSRKIPSSCDDDEVLFISESRLSSSSESGSKSNKPGGSRTESRLVSAPTRAASHGTSGYGPQSDHSVKVGTNNGDDGEPGPSAQRNLMSVDDSGSIEYLVDQNPVYVATMKRLKRSARDIQCPICFDFMSQELIEAHCATCQNFQNSVECPICFQSVRISTADIHIDICSGER